MATSMIASMLDELMGRNRNVGQDENVKELEWSDQEVCKYYLVSFCPHDLFTNTRADLGACPKIHDDDLRKKFQEEKESYKKSQYFDEFLRFCHRMVSELEVRIRKAKERLQLTQLAQERESEAGKEAEEKIAMLTDKITQLVDEAEAAGIEGNVEQAQGLMKLCDQLREEKEELRQGINPQSNPDSEYYALHPNQKAMEVCETCGAFLIVGDAQQRIEDHLMGKQHIGYARLKASIDQIGEMRRKFRENREKEIEDKRKAREDAIRKEAEDRKKAREEKEKQRSISKDKDRGERRRSRSRDRDRRDRDKDRDRNHRDRDRDKDRDRRDRRRSRSRDRKDHRDNRRRDDDRRDRHRGGDSRRRSRSRSRDRKNRDRSRDRRNRDRSRSRDRDRRNRDRDRRSSRDRDRDRKTDDKRDSKSREPSRSQDDEKKEVKEEQNDDKFKHEDNDSKAEPNNGHCNDKGEQPMDNVPKDEPLGTSDEPPLASPEESSTAIKEEDI